MNPFNNQKELNRIIKNCVSGKATAEEIKFVESYYQYLDKGRDILDQARVSELASFESENFQAIQAKIEKYKNKRKAAIMYSLMAAAAVLVICLGASIFYVSDNETTIRPQETANIIDVMPGVNKAILTLADGSKVILDNKTDRKILEKTGLTISKTKDGQLIYTVSKTNPSTKNIAYNTIQTSKGNQYQVILPDGTKVWLNAASSLKYPEIFAGVERRVELTGEGYFEVAKDKAHPFIVKTSASSAKGISQEVRVLGTHFNINSYLDEDVIKTTLLEGSVEVSDYKTVKILKPGEQSKLDANKTSVINADTDDETAWKNGLFRFNNSSLKIILNQLERWYDIKIDYSNVPLKRYTGMLPRKAKLSEVLRMLELTGNINFKIEKDKQLKVFKNKN